MLPDSAANGVFIPDDTHAHQFVSNITPSQPQDRVQLTLPDGSRISSSATGTLRTPPGIPPLEAHLFPGLHSDPLLGLRPLCDQRLTVTFSYDAVTVADPDGCILWTGPRDFHTGMWQLPIGSTPSAQDQLTSTVSNHLAFSANNVIRHTSNAQRVAFYHSCFGSPALSTFIKALESGLHLPGITAAMVRSNPPNPLATPIGHLDQTRQQSRATHRPKHTAAASPPPSAVLDSRNLPSATDTDPDQLDPVISPAVKTVWTRRIELTGRHASDTTGRLPVMSLSGKEYMVVFYDEDSNSIHVEPANSRSSTDRVAAYTRGEAYFRNCGFTPRF